LEKTKGKGSLDSAVGLARDDSWRYET